MVKHVVEAKEEILENGATAGKGETVEVGGEVKGE